MHKDQSVFHTVGTDMCSTIQETAMLFFHCNNGYANAARYVIRTLSCYVFKGLTKNYKFSQLRLH